MELRDIVTFRDAVKRLLQRRGLEGTPRELSQAQIAVQAAYRDLATAHDWQYYNRRLHFRTSAAVSLTVTYDHTGGAHERLLTASSGTWPIDAALGEFRINRELYKIDKRISDTQVTLSSDRSPGADTSGTGQWTRSSYVMPYQIRHVNELYRANGSALVYFTPQAQSSRVEVLYDQSGSPWMFTLSPSNAIFGWTDIRLIPTPADAQNYLANVTIKPSSLSVYEVSGVDGVAASGATTLTSAAPSQPFTSKLVGAIIRINSTNRLPKDTLEFDSTRDPFAFQTRVAAVASATELTLESPMPFAATASGYSISDHVDIAIPIMLSYFEASCWYQFAMNHDVESLGTARAVCQEELSNAIVSDSQVNWSTFVKPEFVDFRRLGIIDRSSLRL